MKPRIVISVLVLVACVGAAMSTRTAESQDRQQSDRDDRINKLLAERRDTLRGVVDAAMEQYISGEALLDTVIHARKGLLEAEMELATTNAERIRIHEKRVKNLRQLEDSVKDRHAAGTAGVRQVLTAKAARLKAEVELLRAQATDD